MSGLCGKGLINLRRQTFENIVIYKTYYRQDKMLIIQAFSPFPTRFSKFLWSFNHFNPLSDDRILDWSKLKLIADDILKCI